MKETYKVKLPKHITIGDPNYFEEFTGSELERLTVDYDTPKHFTDARVTLEAKPYDEFPSITLLDMTIYLAPKSTMHTYLDGMMYKSQQSAEKPIGVDGKEVPRDYDKAMQYLRSSAEHGNQYAEQLIHSIESNRDWSAAMGSIRLLHHLSRMLQQQMRERDKANFGQIDRKLKRKIDEKKEAQGLRQG